MKQFFKIVELMGHKELAEKCQHINFGLVLGMATAGNQHDVQPQPGEQEYTYG